MAWVAGQGWPGVISGCDRFSRSLRVISRSLNESGSVGWEVEEAGASEGEGWLLVIVYTEGIFVVVGTSVLCAVVWYSQGRVVVKSSTTSTSIPIPGVRVAMVR